jgi:hypothetical protein
MLINTKNLKYVKDVGEKTVAKIEKHFENKSFIQRVMKNNEMK